MNREKVPLAIDREILNRMKKKKARERKTLSNQANEALAKRYVKKSEEEGSEDEEES